MKQWLTALLCSALLSTTAWGAVDINTATAAQLEALPGIGASKAQAIVDYRTKHGPFKSADDLTNVPGIKEGTYSKIKGEVTVGKGSPAKAAAVKPTAKPTPAKKDK
ncbi:MAG TPA: helix-hairpin-helix domain-containing protein [Chitinolyticbacter sp.]|nr:helix-hairpin-helix domain-containing protein [Chitinolyticbacter sp.]